jgi:GntP family gluconate:H+ symporter
MNAIPGFSPNSSLLLYALIAVAGLVVLIARFKLNAFVALVLASLFVGLCSGLNLPEVVKAFTEGVGAVLGSVAVVVGLGTILGKLLAESGGAAVIAHTMISTFGAKRMHWTMVVVAFIVGIPVWFTVGLVLLIPIVFTIAKETRTPLLHLGIPLVAGLAVAHGLVPPHPGPMVAIELFKADAGKTILYSLVIGLPTALVAGPIFGKFIAPRVPVELAGIGAGLASKSERTNRPGFGLTLFTILLPILLMMLATVVDVVLPASRDKFDISITSVATGKKEAVARVVSEIKPGLAPGDVGTLVERPRPALVSQASKAEAESLKKRLEDAGAKIKVQGNPVREWSSFIGSPTVAMLLGVLFSLYSFGWARGFDKQQISKFTDECLAPVATVLLVVGAGGGLSRVLINSGVGNAIADLARGTDISPLLFGWLVAALIRVATGSATVAISTAAGIVAPMATSVPGTNLELVIIAMGAGSAILSHLNDGGFWFVKEYLNMTVPQTLKTWTVMETIVSLVALILALLLDALIR